jgi:dolichyl-phosphate-mannose--protein O-mannosyl transferase
VARAGAALGTRERPPPSTTALTPHDRSNLRPAPAARSHPPLGKLVFWAVCKLVGYDWEKCGYANISDEFGAECKYMAIRVTAAGFGTLTAPLFYFIVRNWGGSILAAILASYAFIVDGLNTTEDRLILTDSQLMFWIAAALLSAQMWWRRYNDHTLAVEAYRRDNKNKWPTAAFMRERKEYAGRPFHIGRARQLWCVWIGFVTANAISIKWTALATPGLIALESFFAVFFLRRSVDFLDLLKVAGAAFVTYANWFYWHFWLLPKAGASPERAAGGGSGGGGGAGARRCTFAPATAPATRTPI